MAARVPVYVIEPPVESFVDEALQQRLDSTRELRSRLASMRRIQVVDSPDQAVLVVEVVGHTEQPAARKDVTMWGVHTRFERLVTVRLTVGSYATEVIGRVSPDFVTGQPGAWSGAAFLAALEVFKWVEANEQRLPQPKIPPPDVPPPRGLSPMTATYLALGLLVVLLFIMFKLASR